MQDYFIIEDTPQYPDSPIIATTTLEVAEQINRDDFAGEGTIRKVTEAELVAEGFDPEQVREEAEPQARHCPICGYRLDDYGAAEVVCGACLDNYPAEARRLGDPSAA